MLWEIVGADRVTGDERRARVEAPDAQAAEAHANKSGILFTSITPVEVSEKEYRAAALREADARLMQQIGAEARCLSSPEWNLSAASTVVGMALSLICIGGFVLSFLALEFADSPMGHTENGLESALAATIGFGLGGTIGVLLLILGAAIRLRATMRAIRRT